MVPDRQKVWTDGMDGRTDRRTDDAKTISLRLRLGIISNIETVFLVVSDKVPGIKIQLI